MNILTLSMAVLLLFEGLLVLVVRMQRRSFPWLITDDDEYPVHSDEVIQKFIRKSYDPDLGWVRRPNSRGLEQGKNGTVSYSIDSIGARVLLGGLVPKVAAFGDSYVFCRQVEDDETWPVQLSGMMSRGVVNFGVGNYGADQALIRYEKTMLPDTVEHVILGFVPETICRIQSSWKHYLEFGNTLAFKPRFTLMQDGSLQKQQNPISKPEELYKLKTLIPTVRKQDIFYLKKFRSMKFSFPYTLSFFRHAAYNSMLITSVALRALMKLLKLNHSFIDTLPFSIVMKRNIRDAHKMYLDIEATMLLTAILKRFVDQARSRGHRPLILVMPQLLDLKVAGSDPSYRKYFAELGEKFPVIDLTEALMHEDCRACYVNDQYGGHFSVAGNQLVAKRLFEYFKQRGFDLA